MPVYPKDTAAFFSLHRPGMPFVLPNAWDAASAVMLHRAGFPAIGTTSLGIAAGAGVPDGHGHTFERSCALVQQITKTAPEVLVTCDLENGYSDDPERVAALLDGLPVVGVNIEDSTHEQVTDPVVHAAKIAAIKHHRPDLFVNARVDTYWTGIPDLEETVARVRRYVDAGADGIFVPGDLPLATIATIAEATPVPVNVLASSRYSRTDLAGAGVARISTGSLLYRAALTAAVSTAETVRDDTIMPIPDPVGYRETQALATSSG